MRLKEVSKCPQEGQFVVVWQYNNHPWSAAYQWEDVDLYSYSNDTSDYWNREDYSLMVWNTDRAQDVKFFVVYGE